MARSRSASGPWCSRSCSRSTCSGAEAGSRTNRRRSSVSIRMPEHEAEIPIPPRGTKGAWMPSGRVFKTVTKPYFNRELKRLENPNATEQAKFMGFPVGVVTTVGAKSGAERKHVLGVFPDGRDTWLVIASNGGSPAHPHWFVNIARNPDQVWLTDRKSV